MLADMHDPHLQASGEVVAAHFTEGSPAAASMGVFVGIQQMEYGNLAAPFLAKMGPFTATGGPFSVAAGRVSFTFGFKGPAVSTEPCLEHAWHVQRLHASIQQMEYGNLAAPFLAKMGPFTATGGPFSVAAGRVSFTFNGFKGPAVSIAV